jgi:hypothetical protein
MGARMSDRVTTAKFILAECAKLGIRVGTNGTDDLLMIAPLRIPIASRRTFEEALEAYRTEIIDIVWREGTQ